jgi:hypothetical protein
MQPKNKMYCWRNIIAVLQFLRVVVANPSTLIVATCGEGILLMYSLMAEVDFQAMTSVSHNDSILTKKSLVCDYSQRLWQIFGIRHMPLCVRKCNTLRPEGTGR